MTDLGDKLIAIREGVEAELELLPPEADMREFDRGAAAAYSWVLALIGPGEEDKAVVRRVLLGGKTS